MGPELSALLRSSFWYMGVTLVKLESYGTTRPNKLVTKSYQLSEGAGRKLSTDVKRHPQQELTQIGDLNRFHVSLLT